MEGFGLILTPLSEADLEQVRQWRNDEQTARYMEFRNEISPEDQKLWFLSLKNAHYFIITTDSVPVGLIDLKKIDEIKKTAESGLLIGNKKFVGTGIALGASVLLLDFAFERLKLEAVTAKISTDNNEAEKYNRLLGFKPEKSLNDRFNEWVLTRAAYQITRKQLIRLLIGNHEK